ncbi:MAG: helicase HerA-like domain-containing protein, partial [Mycobacterium sp.]
QVEQTVKLIRSRGVGVFFCTQLPTDIPNEVLSQLGARIQHALRAFTPDDQKALTRTVRTYPKTDVYDLASALTSLGIGEAVVTVLSERGAPTPVAWTRLRSPHSLMASIGDEAIKKAAHDSDLREKYGETKDRESAYEKIEAEKAQTAKAKAEAQANQPAQTGSKSKSSPAPAKKEGWLRSYLKSREGRSLINKLATLVIQIFTNRRR